MNNVCDAKVAWRVPVACNEQGADKALLSASKASAYNMLHVIFGI